MFPPCILRSFCPSHMREGQGACLSYASGAWAICQLILIRRVGWAAAAGVEPQPCLNRNGNMVRTFLMNSSGSSLAEKRSSSSSCVGAAAATPGTRRERGEGKERREGSAPSWLSYFPFQTMLFFATDTQPQRSPVNVAAAATGATAIAGTDDSWIVLRPSGEAGQG